MEPQLALSPDLGIDPAAFAEAWNAIPECRAVAEARLTELPKGQFEPLTGTLLVVLAGLASGIAGNALYDLIKMALPRQETGKRTTIVQVDQPDGTRLLVVTTDEE